MKLRPLRSKLATWIYRIAAVYGVLVTLPLLFTEQRFGVDHPPAITHPEFYYGFAGLVLVWQIAFWLIASDPVRYRPLMLVTVLEKLSFVIVTAVLYPLGRIDWQMLAAGGIDAVLGVLFVIAFVKTPGGARADS